MSEIASCGTHIGKVMEQLGIANAMAKKVILKPALDGGVQLVAAANELDSALS